MWRTAVLSFNDARGSLDIPYSWRAMVKLPIELLRLLARACSSVSKWNTFMLFLHSSSSSKLYVIKYTPHIGDNL